MAEWDHQVTVAWPGLHPFPFPIFVCCALILCCELTEAPLTRTLALAHAHGLLLEQTDGFRLVQ